MSALEDIVVRIRKRFPNPKDAEDGLLSNEAADEIEKLRLLLQAATKQQGAIASVLESLSASLRVSHVC